MWPVTYQTIFVGLALNVGFMAVKAGWPYAMLVGVATCTSNLLIVLARMGGHFFAFWFIMANFTGNL